MWLMLALVVVLSGAAYLWQSFGADRFFLTGIAFGLVVGGALSLLVPGWLLQGTLLASTVLASAGVLAERVGLLSEELLSEVLPLGAGVLFGFALINLNKLFVL
ncbi:MAG: hypothetical protein H7Y22_09880 [Gemmatimonadaceae bacterium]|nr:hypothetical protein [Gloeobacterales cyanobacterium ES-bin-141]